MSNLVKAHEDANINRADTMNRLTKSLEESQRQCSDLLEAGVCKPVHKLCTKTADNYNLNHEFTVFL